MPRKTLILLILLAVIPLAGFAWLGWRTARGEEARIEQTYRQLFEARLAQENSKLSDYFSNKRRELADQCEQHRDNPEQLRDFVRTSPLVRQAIVIDRNGDLIHPAVEQNASNSERAFIQEIRQLLVDKDLIRASFGPDNRLAQSPPPASNTPVTASDMTLGSSVSDLGSSADETQLSEDDALLRNDAGNAVQQMSPKPITYSSPQALTRRGAPRAVGLANPTGRPESSEGGWYVWYFERGAHVLYWHRWSDQRVTVVALSRPRYIADLLSTLPNDMPRKRDTSGASVVEGDNSDWRICLVDAADRLVYQWGSHSSAEGESPLAQTSVDDPLSAWRLKYYGTADLASYSKWPLLGAIMGLGVGLLAMVVTLHRDYTRDMREASQRVNFVNQVSHELKTPLTNIRMYADLLDLDLEKLPADDVAKPKERLDVIVTESQRLSRLIANVLSFARSERNQLDVNRRPTEFDTLITDLVNRFTPALQSANIHVSCQLAVPQTIDVDADAVQQIVGNLVSNVVNYASRGKQLRLETSYENSLVTVIVGDKGPGISAPLKRRLFEPFVRESSQLNDVNGTGIGLSIARRLARAHGGNLELESVPRGAEFRLTLSTVSDPEPGRKAGKR